MLARFVTVSTFDPYGGLKIYQSYYDAEAGIVFLRFHGVLAGAETQGAMFESVKKLDDPSNVVGVLLDYREVTAADMSDSDRALARINARRLLELGLDIADMTMAWLSDPTRRDVALILERRMTVGLTHSANLGFTLTAAKSQLEEAFRALGLPEDYRLPY